MIKFFRQIRSNLIFEDKTGKYLKYAIGEIILVVIGILIALQINNWNENRKNNSEEIIILKSLKSEFVENQALLKFNINKHSNILELLKELNTHISPEPTEISNDKLDTLMYGLMALPKYSPNDGVINSIIGSAKISLIKNNELSTMLASLNSNLNFYNTVAERNEKDVYEHIIPYIKDKYSFRQTTQMYMRSAGIREDNKFKYSKNDLLADLGFESLVANRLVDAYDLLNFAKSIEEFQAKILELIESELKK